MTERPSTRAASGPLAMALGAHLFWGLMPLYLLLVAAVPAFELVGWRVIFTVPLCLLFVTLRGQTGDVLAALRNWRVLRLLLCSAAMISANWLIYVAAIQSGHVLATSLAYYLTPLLQVAAGTLFLGERLSPRQWAAVGFAGLGVGLLAWGPLDMLWISLSLAVSWGIYGLIRKVTPVGALPGLTIETLVILPGALALTAWYAAAPAGSSLGVSTSLSLGIAFSGVVTAAPLTLFAMASRRMDFTTLGMLQFTSPTLVFILGITVFGLPLKPLQLLSFALIWVAIGLFLWDLLAQRRSAEVAPA